MPYLVQYIVRKTYISFIDPVTSTTHLYYSSQEEIKNHMRYITVLQSTREGRQARKDIIEYLTVMRNHPLLHALKYKELRK